MEDHPAGRAGTRQLRQVAVAAAIVLAGCASAPPIVPTGPGAYLVSRQAATGFSGMGDLKVEAIRDAGAYCTGMGKSLTVTGTQESQPPFMLGNYPRVEVRFTCT